MSPIKCYPPIACTTALDEAKQLYPARRRTSDGICASSSHSQQNPGSDHEPNIIYNTHHYASAFDLSHDPEHGCDAFALAELLRLSEDSRIKYVICNHKMYSSYAGRDSKTGHAFSAWEWRDYHGSNPHTSHIHVSIIRTEIFSPDLWWGPLLEETMTDGTRNRMIREWYLTYINREPTISEQTWWRGHWYSLGDNGEDLTLAGIYDSEEAKKYRKAQGKAQADK